VVLRLGWGIGHSHDQGRHRTAPRTYASAARSVSTVSSQIGASSNATNVSETVMLLLSASSVQASNTARSMSIVAVWLTPALISGPSFSMRIDTSRLLIHFSYSSQRSNSNLSVPDTSRAPRPLRPMIPLARRLFARFNVCVTLNDSARSLMLVVPSVDE